MKRPTSLLVMVIAALAFGSAPLHASADKARPRLEQYASYNEFLRAMVAWESRPAATREKPETPVPVAADAQLTTRPIPVPEGIDPTSETAPPPLAITGPEDLDVAVKLAKDIKHPNYTNPIRYNRTTHISFPLHSIEGSDMSQASVPNALQVGKTANNPATPLEAIDQQLSHEQIKQNETPKVDALEAVPGISRGLGSAAIHIVLESQY